MTHNYIKLKSEKIKLLGGDESSHQRMEKCNKSFQHYSMTRWTIPFVSTNSTLFVDTQRYDITHLSSLRRLSSKAFFSHPNLCLWPSKSTGFC